MEKVHRPTERVIEILCLVSRINEGLSFTEISLQTDIPKSTLSPILQTLVDYKMLYLNKNTMRYKIGSKSFRIGYAFVEDIDIIEEIKDEMEEVVSKCDEICQLGILDGENVLYMAKVEPDQSIKLDSSVGKSFPAYATALGKCLLANFSNTKLKSMYNKELVAITKNTITNVDELIDKVSNVRQRGIAYEWGESNEQVMCLAVPIKHKDRAIFSLSVSVPIYRAEEEKLKEIENILVESRSQIEKQIDLIGVANISKFY